MASKEEVKRRMIRFRAAARRRDERLKNFDAIDSAALGALQGLTFGFSDEIMAGVKALASPGSFSDNFDSIVEQERKRIRDAEAANPRAFGVADTASSFATLFIPGGAALRGAKLLSKGVGRASAFAGQGAIQGAGRAEGEEKLKGAALGAGLGLFGGAATQAVGSAVRGSGSRLLQSLSRKSAGPKANEMARETGIKIAKKVSKGSDNPELTEIEVQEILGGLKKNVVNAAKKDPQMARSLENAAKFKSDPTIGDIAKIATAPLEIAARGVFSPRKSLLGAKTAFKRSGSAFDAGLRTAPLPLDLSSGVATASPAAVRSVFSE